MGSPVIFSGSNAKFLKSNLDINGAVSVLTGTVNPSSVATSAPAGSLYLNTSTGVTYQKQDAGSSTNWLALATGTSSMSSWTQDNTFGTTGFGTISSANFWKKTVGDTLQVRGDFVCGTTTAVSAFINFPSGTTINNAKYSNHGAGQILGFGYTLVSGGVNTPSTSTGPFPIAYDGTTTSGVYIATSINSAFSKTNGTAIASTGQRFAFLFEATVT